MHRFRPYLIMSMYLVAALVFAYIVDSVYIQAAGVGAVLENFCK